MTELLDARGVAIEPGDTAIYGFGVGRSVAMAEAVVLGEEVCEQVGPALVRTEKVSLTPSGRVRLRIVRRSYDSGTKPVVDVAPDRLVVLKHPEWTDGWDSGSTPSLPPSPLPTQAEEARTAITDGIERYTKGLRATVAPAHRARAPEADDPEALALVEYHAFCAGRLRELRKRLKALDES